MSNQDPKYDELWKRTFYRWMRLVTFISTSLLLIVLLSIIFIPFQKSILASFEPGVEPTSLDAVSFTPTDPDLVKNGIHLATGLAHDENFELVRSVCTSCHSAKLITQNRASRAGWKSMIKWMQATQGLQNLGAAEEKIVDYLSKHYAPTKLGRRQNLVVSDVDWYKLELD